MKRIKKYICYLNGYQQNRKLLKGYRKAIAFYNALRVSATEGSEIILFRCPDQEDGDFFEIRREIIRKGVRFINE